MGYRLFVIGDLEIRYWDCVEYFLKTQITINQSQITIFKNPANTKQMTIFQKKLYSSCNIFQNQSSCWCHEPNVL